MAMAEQREVKRPSHRTVSMWSDLEVKSDAALFTPANVHAARVYRDCGHEADVEIGGQS